MTQLAIDISPIKPPQSAPVTKPLFVCPVRDKCIMPTRIREDGREMVIEMSRAKMGIPCGFELVGTVQACPKRKRLEVER